MNPIVVGIIVGAVTTLARWSRGKPIGVDTVVGVVGIALGLAVIDQANKELAKAFGTLIVVAVVIVHGQDLFDAVTRSTGSTTTGGSGGSGRNRMTP